MPNVTDGGIMRHIHRDALITSYLLINLLSVSTSHAEYTFAHSYALVMGINNYETPNRYTHLNNSVRDAEEFAEYIKGQGFEVKTMLNSEATRDHILSYLVDELLLRDKAGEDSRVLFFFGGHGTTLVFGGAANSQQVGYIVPYDAGQSTASLISMDDLNEVVARLRNVRHVVLILNSCFGGSITRSGDVRVDPKIPNYLEAIVISRETLKELEQDGTLPIAVDVDFERFIALNVEAKRQRSVAVINVPFAA
jgi:Caspase domain